MALGVITTGAAMLALLPLYSPESTRLDRVTPTTTDRTRTSHTMNDPADETAVRKLAERYLAAVNTRDDATVARLNCAKAAPGLLQMVADGRRVTMTGLDRAPVRARYYVGLTIDGAPVAPMIVEQRDGDWCVRD
ncbi:hypothetical protein [Actinophytocola sp. NPDC049390]|uniref:hypothetical protein n=1 Tax=Actinophytocola sp. NPDC049390 TaxID=3363894 RepID=UPI0037AB6730